MATDYDKITDLPAASALDGTELSEVVQSGTSKKATVDQIAESSAMTDAFQPIADGIANTVQVVKEYMLTEDNELDYSSSITNGMAAATVTFTELPANTVAILVKTSWTDLGAAVRFSWRRTSGGTQEFDIRCDFADGGNNTLRGTYWLPTGGNSIYATVVTSSVNVEFEIIGYKTSA